jgi:phenylpyruvate tautomerase PptA (4-oxalocrotonate tautomerase family)
MPSVVIEIKKQYSQAQERALIDAVFDAMVSVFKIRACDSTIRLIVHEPHRYQADPDLTYPERHTHISIDMFEGRTLVMKRELYQTIVNNLVALEIPKNHVEILLREVNKENWGICGGQAACDLA